MDNTQAGGKQFVNCRGLPTPRSVHYWRFHCSAGGQWGAEGGRS